MNSFVLFCLIIVLCCRHVYSSLTDYEDLKFAHKHSGCDVDPTVSFMPTRLEACVDECDKRPSCAGLSYSRNYHLCLLKIVHTGAGVEPIETVQDSSFVFAQKKAAKVNDFFSSKNG